MQTSGRSQIPLVATQQEIENTTAMLTIPFLAKFPAESSHVLPNTIDTIVHSELLPRLGEYGWETRDAKDQIGARLYLIWTFC